MKGNPYLSNPYLAMYGGVPFKSPDQYQAEMEAQLNQYRQAYGQAGAGSYYKVSSYDEMMRIQAPADGRPVMVLDEQNARLYSKHFENGQTYVAGFALVPLDKAENAKTPQNPNKLQDILKSLDDRLSALEGKNASASADE